MDSAVSIETVWHMSAGSKRMAPLCRQCGKYRDCVEDVSREQENGALMRTVWLVKRLCGTCNQEQ